MDTRPNVYSKIFGGAWEAAKESTADLFDVSARARLEVTAFDDRIGLRLDTKGSAGLEGGGEAQQQCRPRRTVLDLGDIPDQVLHEGIVESAQKYQSDERTIKAENMTEKKLVDENPGQTKKGIGGNQRKHGGRGRHTFKL